jgi:tryptophan synthase alpha chain
VIQRAGQRALAAGTKLSNVFDIVASVRQRHQTPLLLMGYLNPILNMGEERFMDRCAAADLDGLIIPDLLPEESGTLRALAKEREIATVSLVATASTPERVKLACDASSGFVYLVSVSGVTGARQQLPSNLGEHISRVQAASSVPVVVGFGISLPEQVAEIGALAEGVVVGSALVACAEEAKSPQERISQVTALVRTLRQATGR